MDKLHDVIGKLTVDTLSAYYDVFHNTMTINLFDVASMKAVNSVSMNKILSAVPEDYGKCWWHCPVTLLDT